MGGGGKGGDANQSGMYEAMASAQAAQQAYALGEQQLQWTKDVYNQQWPTILASANAQMALEGQQAKNLEQMTQEAGQQWGTYQQNYLPEELKLIGQVNDWASPGNQALVRGQAMGDIAEQGQAGMNTAAETSSRVRRQSLCAEIRFAVYRGAADAGGRASGGRHDRFAEPQAPATGAGERRRQHRARLGQRYWRSDYRWHASGCSRGECGGGRGSNAGAEPRHWLAGDDQCQHNGSTLARTI